MFNKLNMTHFISINPYTEKPLHQFHLIGNSAITEVVQQAKTSGENWKKVSFETRGELILRLGDFILQNQQELAELAVNEMGKPIKEALAEVAKCKTACDYYAHKSEQLLAPVLSKADTGKFAEINYEPLGVILGIFPWNFPYWQIIRSVVPAIMAGNSFLIKPAPNVPKCALALQQLFHDAGIPEGVVQTIFASEDQISNLISNPVIQACTLTGSETAGSIVAMQAAKHIKKSVLELGGSDPFIVMEDANLELATSTAITARFQNNGQSCIASKRFILHMDIADSFLQLLIPKIGSLKLGNPMDLDVQIGPMARRDLLEKLKQQVLDSVKAGAKIIYQHPQECANGFFYPPTVLSDIPKDSPAYMEELFGPVLSVFVVKDESEAIHVANDTKFGLGASVWSSNVEYGNRIAKELVCGTVFINGLVKSHAQYPFGGAKHSGFGRELGEWGLKEFCNVKTIWK